MIRSRQTVFRAAVWVLVTCSSAGLLFILGAQFSGTDAAGTSSVRPPVPVLPESLLVAGLIALGLGAVFAIVRLVVVSFGRDAPARPRRDRRQLYAIAAIMVSSFLVFYVLVAFVLSFVQLDEEEPVELPRSEEEGEPVEEELEQPLYEQVEPPSDAMESDERSGVYLLIATGLFALAAGYVGLRAYRSYAARPDASETAAMERLSADLHATSARGLARMLEEPDHRRAVIAAYALVEDTFERHGYTRDSSYTPVEFMRATLRELESARTSPGDGAEPVPRDALLSLTRLYEVARFSEHPVGPGERADAVDSLERIGAALRRVGGRRGHDRSAARGGERGR